MDPNKNRFNRYRLITALEVLSNLQSSVFAMDMETDVAEVREKLGAANNFGTTTRTADI